jgi:hypothetical protein
VGEIAGTEESVSSERGGGVLVFSRSAPARLIPPASSKIRARPVDRVQPRQSSRLRVEGRSHTWLSVRIFQIER